MIDRPEWLRRLWEEIFSSPQKAGEIPSDPRMKHHRAIDQLHVHLMLLSAADMQDRESQHFLLIRAMTIWQLLSTEIGEQLLNADSSNFVEGESLLATQVRLWALLDRQLNCTIPEVFKSAIDPIAVFLPRKVLIELVESLEALQKGETLPLFMPHQHGRHGDAYTWDMMRFRAIEHVYFLVGQGVAKGIAQRRVSAAMHKVSPETLKSWERDAKQDYRAARQLSAAQSAGEIRTILDSNPSAAESFLGSIASNKLESFAKEPLGVFGDQYNAAFGQRHNS
jgi:hypothetical protein